VNAVDNPARQSFVIEMVGPDRVVNAVGLNSVLVHSARIAGPALAGVLIALVGVEPCFALNVLSFGVMIWALRAMDPAALATPDRAPREPRALRAALAYVKRTPELAVPLGIMALVGTFGLNFQVILPLFARFEFEGGAGAYAALLAAMGAGSVIGALITASHGRTGLTMVSHAAFVFGVLSLIAAAAPSLIVALPLFAALGGAAVTFAAGINSTLQLAVSPQMRGRVLALYSIVFLGSTPIGGPLAGFLSEAYSPRIPLVLAASAGLAAAWAARRAGERLSHQAVQPTPA
jgi:MFS family permease